MLVIGRDESWLLALMLTSQDHDRDAAQEARHGQWVDVGTGSWDRQGRPSEARIDRIVRVDPALVRREGAVLSRERFAEVAAAVRAAHRRRHAGRRGSAAGDIGRGCRSRRTTGRARTARCCSSAATAGGCWA